jgi:SsrA-binding protein
MRKEQEHKGVTINNRKAWHDYDIGEQYEVGIALVGTEVKSLRQSKGSIQEAFCKIENGEVIVHGMHIAPYEQGNRFNVDPLRPRKLLLKKAEIHRIERQLLEKGFTLVPLKLYFSRGYAKLNIGLARGKKLYDKREAITAREVERSRRREEAGKE